MTVLQAAPARNRFAPARTSWRRLLVHVEPDQAAAPRLQAAADLAEKLDARLTGLGAEMLRPIGASDPYGLSVEFVGALREVVQMNLGRAEGNFADRTTGLRAEWMAIEAMPAEAIGRLSRAADLVIAGGSPVGAHDAYRMCDPAELALHCGRPVLVVPPQGGRLDATRVVVAWKDTREARRALADSLPILKCAEQVLVMAISSRDEAESTRVHVSAVLDYLLDHGIEARSRVVAANEAEAAPLIQAEARAIDADLIVAGAYGRTRLGEWLFGGVTLGLLSEPERFLLISH